MLSRLHREFRRMPDQPDRCCHRFDHHVVAAGDQDAAVEHRSRGKSLTRSRKFWARGNRAGCRIINVGSCQDLLAIEPPTINTRPSCNSAAA